MLKSAKRRWTLTGLLALLALLVWASWEEPSLHHYAAPVQVALLRVEGLQTPGQVAAMEQQMNAVPGVAACAFNPRTGLVTLLYDESHTSEAELTRILSVGGALAVQRVQQVAEAPTARQCPVPASYVQALERLRFALNLRRLFIRV